jgi:Flp pilus assembly protein TadG
LSLDAGEHDIMIKRCVRSRASRFMRDGRASVAVEFAAIVPLMFTMFFGTVEFSSALAVNRKVTLVARTMSDLTSQSTTVTDIDLANFTTTAKAMMTPYSATPLNTTVSELYVDPTTLTAKVKWSKGTAPLGLNTTVAIPTALKIAGTYLIYAQVDYKYTPAVGYLIDKTIGVTLKDFTYTRPRQSLCVLYGATVCPT